MIFVPFSSSFGFYKTTRYYLHDWFGLGIEGVFACTV